jgi:hypothetical protein
MQRQHKPVKVTAAKRPPRQLALGFEAPQLWRMSKPERQRAVARLASLLMQSAGVAPMEEDGDDRR